MQSGSRRAMRARRGIAFSTAVALALASASTIASAGPGPSFRLDSDSLVRIPIQVRGNLIYLRGRINGSDSLWIVLDSGAGSNAIDADRAGELGFDVRERGEVRGAGGTARSGMVSDVKVELQGLTIDHASLTTIPLGNLAAPTGRRIDAILGEPLLHRYAAEIDYDAAVLTLFDPDRFRAPLGAAELPIHFEAGLPYVTALIKIPGQPATEGRFTIDTGSANALILTAPFVRDHHALEAVGRTLEIRGNGVGGQSRNRLGRLDSLALGGFGFSRPTATLRVADVGIVAAAGAIGNIGGEVLHRFTVSFDYPRRRMFLAPNRHFAEPFEADMSGLGFQMGPPGTHHLEVMWVQPDSPAAEAGVRAGDAIEQVNGAAPDSLGPPALRAMFRRPAETYRLLIRRDGRTQEVVITTRRLI